MEGTLGGWAAQLMITPLLKATIVGAADSRVLSASDGMSSPSFIDIDTEEATANGPLRRLLKSKAAPPVLV